MNKAAYEAVVEKVMRGLERRWFIGTDQVKAIKLVFGLAEGAQYRKDLGIIEMDVEAARFTRFNQVLILHELVHHKLYKADPSYEPYGEKFYREIDRLWNDGAYRDII